MAFDRQLIFNRVWEHFVGAHGEPCMDEERNHCYHYVTSEGKRVSDPLGLVDAGRHLDGELADKGVDYVFRQRPEVAMKVFGTVDEDDMVFLEDMQECHDLTVDRDPNNFHVRIESRLFELADRYGLCSIEPRA